MTTVDAIKSTTSTLIDVREPYELEIDGAISHATNIPLGQIPERVEEIKQMPKPIVVFCRSGGRSSKTIEFLIANGIDEIYNGGGYVDVLEVLNQE